MTKNLPGARGPLVEIRHAFIYDERRGYAAPSARDVIVPWSTLCRAVPEKRSPPRARARARSKPSRRFLARCKLGDERTKRAVAVVGRALVTQARVRLASDALSESRRKAKTP